MKTAVYNAPAEIVSDGKKIQFKMSASPKAFSILADGIYSDKITAVIRELSTNAWDSHVQAGNNNPFDVHLPTTFNQNFFIRDYGVGLSEEEIETIYTTFFDSNKTDSNEYTGGLGLGSKTPFCYNTKSFVITSFKNGLKLIYSAYIDEYGYPSLVKMSEEQSDEPSGLKVEFPVKNSDIYDFKSKSKYLYRWFSTKPNFVGSKIDFDEEPDQEFITTKSNYINRVDISKYYGVVMGNIFYPYRFFSNSNFVVYCDIGSLDIETSREGLAFTEKTKRRLDVIKKTINENYVDLTQKQIDKCENMWEAILLASKIRDTSGRDFDTSSFNYKGKKVESFFNAFGDLQKIQSIRYGYKDNYLLSLRVYYSAKSQIEALGLSGIFLANSSYAKKRVKDYANTNGRCLLIPDEKTLDMFCDWISFPKELIKGTDSLPLNINKKSYKRGSKKGRINILQSNNRKSYCYNSIEIDFSTYDFTNHYYLVSNRYNIIDHKGVEQHPNYATNIKNNLLEIGYKDDIKIIAITKEQEKGVSNYCTNFWKFLEKLSKDSNIISILNDNMLYYKSFSYQEESKAKILMSLSQSTQKGHILCDYVSSYEKHKKQSAIYYLLDHMFSIGVTKLSKYDTVSVFKKIDIKYPLISYDKDKINVYQKYINLVDKGVF